MVLTALKLGPCQLKWNCRTNRLFPERNKTDCAFHTMTTTSILKPLLFFDAEKRKIEFRVRALKRLRKPRQNVDNNRRKAALCGVPGEDTHSANVRIWKPWVGGDDSSTGSEVTAGGITERVHSLVAAPLMRVCPEEFSVGSSRQSSGRGQT